MVFDLKWPKFLSADKDRASRPVAAAAAASAHFLDRYSVTKQLKILGGLLLLLMLIIATVIYALPPLVRLTDLGIRQVPEDIVEAGKSFGCTPTQLLLRVQLPLARPSIMAGINQSVMMALGMIVIASMIGARGLGEDVLAGINNLDIGRGLQAGMAIVILAIVIDRISQAFGKGQRHRSGMAKKLQRTAA